MLAADALKKLAVKGQDLRDGLKPRALGCGDRSPCGQSPHGHRQRGSLKAAEPGAATKGHPTGPSGTHLPRTFECWGILAKIRECIVQALAGVAVARLIAKGDVALGFQQLSELLGVPGIEIVGSVPDAAQTVTVFSGAVCSAASAPEAASSWIGFMASQAVDAVKQRTAWHQARLR